MTQVQIAILSGVIGLVVATITLVIVKLAQEIKRLKTELLLAKVVIMLKKKKREKRGKINMVMILKDIFTKRGFGTVGEETKIVDKNGNKLHVGDIVNFASFHGPRENGTLVYTYCQSVIVKPNSFNKAFLMGLEIAFNEDGTYEDDLELELAKSYKDISVGSGYMFSTTTLLYENIDDE